MHTPHINRQTRQRLGYTLVELSVSTIGASVLAIGLASSLVIASKSLNVGDGDLADGRTAHRVIDRLHRDAQSALAISELTATSITMTVADRNGDSVPELIRYAWSGVPGDPLTVQYNGQAEPNAVEDVQAFSLAWATRFMEGVCHMPIVLFVSSRALSDAGVTPTEEEQQRIDLMESWGYEVQLISQYQSSAEIEEAFTDVNVAFVSGEVSGSTLSTKLNAATIGVVTESSANSAVLGLISAASTVEAASISIISHGHYITEPYSLGSLAVADDELELKFAYSVAPGARLLASYDYGAADSDAAALAPTGPVYAVMSSLIAVEVGTELVDNSSAAGQRAQLPWGDDEMEIEDLNEAGRDLMKRSIEWAAGAGGEVGQSGIVFEEYTDATVDPEEWVTIPKPTGTAQNDLLIAAVAYDGNNGFESPPAGWTLLHSNNRSGKVTFGVWWKLASAAEPPEYTFRWGDAEHGYGWIMRFTGHNAQNPIGRSTSKAATSNVPTSPAVKVEYENCMILRLGGFDDDDITHGEPGLPGHTAITMNDSGDGTATTSGGAGYVIQESAGGSGTSNFALTASEEAVTVTIAIVPDQSASSDETKDTGGGTSWPAWSY